MDESTVLPEAYGEELVAGPGFAGFDPCCAPVRSRWASVEYLFWWRDGQSLPPLVTTSPDDTAQEEAGVLGFDNTTILFGDETAGQEARPGGRVTLGLALDPMGCHALEGRFFMLGESSISYTETSTGSPILARPFFDDVDEAQASLLLAYPDFTTNGTVDVTSQSDVLGGGVLYHWLVSRVGTNSLDIIGGYEFARINENLTIAHSTEAVDIPTITPGTIFQVRDEFDAQNEFHGGSIGLALQRMGPGWNLELLGKVAFGNMREIVKVSGQTVVTTPEPDSTVDTQDEGLLAQGVNLGTHTRNHFAVAPEFNANLVYQLSPCCDVRLGYSFLYWSRVAQPADQIDPELRVPTQEFVVQDSGYWLHGFSFGTELRF